MQNAKDTFYVRLKSRLAALNPDRTVVVRGAIRPAIIVEENELVLESPLSNCFRLRWSTETINTGSALPTATLRCEVLYETAGTPLNSGMDRGRVLAAMDAELAQMINTTPQNTQKINYSGLAFAQAAKTMTTNIWWSDVAFGDITVSDGKLARTATIDVMSYQEAGEL